MKKFIGVFVIFLILMAWISINIYLPALPALQQYFNTSSISLKFSATLFLCGYTVAQIFWGPLSEKFGRRKLILLGLSISVLGIFTVIFSKNVYQFDIGRFIEALGLGCAPGLGRAMISDSYDTVAMAKILAVGAMCANIMPGIAPLIGVHLLNWFDWQAIFVFILLYTVGVIIVLFFLPETNQAIRADEKILRLFYDYIKLLEKKEFIGYVCVYLLLTGAMIAFYTITPFLFISQMHVAQSLYSNIMIALAGFYVLGALTVRYLAQKIQPKIMIMSCLFLNVICVVGLFLLPRIINYTWLSMVIPMAIYMFSAGIISPSCNTGGIKLMRHIAGVAATALGVAVYAGAAIQSAIINALSLTSNISLATFFAVIVFLAIVCFSFLVGYSRS